MTDEKAEVTVVSTEWESCIWMCLDNLNVVSDVRLNRCKLYGHCQEISFLTNAVFGAAVFLSHRDSRFSMAVSNENLL
jgi:hypothetical protein